MEDAAACTASDRVNTVGGQIGPDLTTIATKYDRAFLVEVVLHASKQILVGDQTTTVALKNGQTSAELLRGQTATEIVLIDVVDEKYPLGRDQTVKQTESATSLMPEGLQAALSIAEFADRVGERETWRKKRGRRAFDPARTPAPGPKDRNSGGNAKTSIDKRGRRFVLVSISGGTGHPRTRCLVAQWQSR